MKKVLFIIVLLVIVAGCADVTNVERCTIDLPYGFWGGLWHGIISPFAFIGSLFSNEIAMYAVNNNGGWYDFGFVLGAGIISFGAAKNT